MINVGFLSNVHKAKAYPSFVGYAFGFRRVMSLEKNSHIFYFGERFKKLERAIKEESRGSIALSYLTQP